MDWRVIRIENSSGVTEEGGDGGEKTRACHGTVLIWCRNGYFSNSSRHGFKARRDGFESSSKLSRRGWGRLKTVISRRGLLRSHPRLDGFEDDPNLPSPRQIFGDPCLASKG